MQDWSCVSEFHGCGPFVRDSWLVFCRGELSAQGVACLALRQYLSWRNATPGSAAEAEAAVRPPKLKRTIKTPAPQPEDTKTCVKQKKPQKKYTTSRKTGITGTPQPSEPTEVPLSKPGRPRRSPRNHK